MEIQGKVFIVTGGASGLGEGTARMLAREGGKVVIADLQIGMWLANTDTIRRVVEWAAGEERPDVVLLAGDFVYEPTEEHGEPREALDELEREDIREAREQVHEVEALLAPLAAAGISVYAVLGNHDYAMQRPDSLALEQVASMVRDGLERAGVTVLHNDAVELDAGRRALRVRLNGSWRELSSRAPG